MTRPASDTLPDLPVHWPHDPARFDQDGPTALGVTATAEECARIAAYLNLAALDGLVFSGTAEPWSSGGWRIAGHLTAAYVQTCVVTLVPIALVADLKIARTYLPAARLSAEAGLDLDPEDPDLPDPFDGTIDLAALIIECLVLDIDPYPRIKGADFGARAYAGPGVAPLSDEALRPFAKLAGLKEKLTGEKD